jgi:hypothetical protein
VNEGPDLQRFDPPAYVEKLERNQRRSGGPLSTQQIREHLKRLAYKPGWAFKAYDGRWEGQHLVIETTVPNTYRPGQTVTLRVESMLPPLRDTHQLEEWLAWRLGRLEIHEMREHLKRDGLCIHDPHAPRAERDLPAFGDPEE